LRCTRARQCCRRAQQAAAGAATRFRKYPGTITVSIGKAIDTRGRKADEVTREVEAWIEGEMGRLEHAGV
jgi:hypothetical protein